jgi:MarR family 2-MHQ and catechol resistance regulon transcriptional repressor
MGTHYKGKKEEIQALNAFIALMRASDSLNSRQYMSLKKSNLTISQFGALEALLHLGPMCQSVLSKKLLKSGGNITMVIDNLEKRGLVKRKRDTDDRRFISVHLTEKGEKLIQKVFPAHAKNIVNQMSVLSDEEQKNLIDYCKRIGLQF